MLELLCTLYIFILFSFITKVHIYWMQGGIWPGENKQDLIDKVIGRGRELPNTFSFIIVIAVFLAMALLPLFFYFNKVLIPSYIVHYVFLFFCTDTLCTKYGNVYSCCCPKRDTNLFKVES
jgi:hypothetical protein